MQRVLEIKFVLAERHIEMFSDFDFNSWLKNKHVRYNDPSTLTSLYISYVAL